jgi:hypothetical protein
MVNNFTIIIKTNNRPSSWLMTLNTHKKRPQQVGNHIPDLGKAQKGGWVKLINGIPTLPSLF